MCDRGLGTFYLLKIKSAESETCGRVVHGETVQLEIQTPCTPVSQVCTALPIYSYTLTFPAQLAEEKLTFEEWLQRVALFFSSHTTYKI